MEALDQPINDSTGAVTQSSFEPLLALMKIGPRDRILELDCGEGEMSTVLAGRVPEGLVVAMDLSEERVYRARARARDLDNVMFMPGGADEIPWKEDYFSKVLSHRSPRELGEVLRVLTPGGFLYLEAVSRRESGAPASEALEEWGERLAAAGFAAVHGYRLGDHTVWAAQKPSPG